MEITTIIAIGAVLVLGWIIIEALKRCFKSVTIFEYQSGLRYSNGKLIGTIGPGRYSTFWPGTHIVVEDMREQLLVIAGQEMLTSDNLSVKVSLSVRHKTADVRLKAVSAQDADALLYNEMQIALRQAVASRTLETLLVERGDVALELLAPAVAQAQERGVEILGVDVRDVMLARETKRAYADIFRAKKDGEAALERARGESAALRSLANAARLLKDNPALYNLRVLQSLSASAATGATVILNTSGEAAPLAASDNIPDVDNASD